MTHRLVRMAASVAFLVVALQAPTVARAGPPTEFLRARIDKLYDLIGGVGLTQAVPERQAAARTVLDEMFDWPEMAKRSLGKYWGERTESERTEFMRLFSELFQRTYLSRIHLADRDRFEYLGEAADGDRVVIRTRVFTKQGRQFPVAYQTRPAPGDQWRIYDLDVDGISLVGNYRNQFTTLIGRSSYADLIEKLRALVGKRPGTSRTDGVVLVAAGDIASCVSEGDEATARLLEGLDGVVATLGDHAYEAGTPIEFAACYDPSWGRHKARTRPAPGNHDYLTPGASGYFEYFGAAAGDPRHGYYSYDLGTWRVIALNSNCDDIGGCGAGSPQERWLRAELAAHPRRCTLAYWHHPRFSSGPHGSDRAYDAFWQALYERDADVVLVGHDHTYERFAPQRPDGTADPRRGIRQFVIGTGGGSHHPFTGPPIANSEVRNDDTFGILKLTLYPSSYDWQFIPVPGRSFTDAGTGDCH